MRNWRNLFQKYKRSRTLGNDCWEEVTEEVEGRGYGKEAETCEVGTKLEGKESVIENTKLKREILLLSVGNGLARSGYCFITLSVQAAASYGIGVLFSLLYLRLLYQHADNLSTETVAQIFRKKKPKKIGIRSEDLQDSLEQLIKGCSMSLSSPRLVIPTAIYGIWVLSHQYFTNDLFFDFQLVPAMFGLFVYKAAVLVQVYGDNDDLQLVFPENDLLD
ncbi:hypothetical protein PIB30_055304 [Stylosanthes scabra]|uniref:CGL160/ATPI domain-containing protein n=1 Tax=Stylosanthes scabra TaxID=79078 RepID=A0ABU6ZHP2_9FABA|nr:hypothetical protein [Stylosanthes scabra]